MKAFDTSRLAFQAIRRYPLRTSMMLLSVAIGVAAVVLLTGVGEGARRYVSGEFAALGTHLIVVLPGKSETAGAGGTGTIIGATARDLTLDDAMAIERSPRIAQVAPIVVGSGNASWRERERDNGPRHDDRDVRRSTLDSAARPFSSRHRYGRRHTGLCNG